MKTKSLHLTVLFITLFAALPSCRKRKVELDGIYKQVYDMYNIGDRFYLLKNKQDTIEFVVTKKEIEHIEGHFIGNPPAVHGHIFISNKMDIMIYEDYYHDEDIIIIEYNSITYVLDKMKMEQDSLLLDSCVVNHITYKGNIYKIPAWKKDTLYFSITDGILYICEKDDINEYNNIYERIK